MSSISCRRFITPASVIFMTLALLGACGSPESDVRTLRIGNGAEPATLDPHRAEGVPERNIQRDLFEGLLRETPEGGFEGGVAERWELSEDGRTYTFYIRPDARWSNGDPVTAGDFVFSFRRAAAPATGGIVTETLYPIRNARAVISGQVPTSELGVVAVDAMTLKIELEESTPYFPELLTHPSTFPVHPPSVSDNEQWTRPGALVSNGAYKLQDWRVQSVITLVKNPEYWDAESVDVERVQFLPIEDSNAELARYAAGELDITYGIPPGRFDSLRDEYLEEIRVAPWFGTYYLGINTTRPPLDDVDVRKALSLAIDRQVLANDVAGNGETPAYAWVPPLPDYSSPVPEWVLWTQAAREDKARALLADAGLDAPVEIEILYNNRDRDQRIVTAVAAMWRQVLGVETRLTKEEWKVYLQSRRELTRTQVFRSGWIGDYPDPNAFAEILRSDHGMNETGWRNSAYDDLLEQAATALDADRRRELLHSAEELVLIDQPIIPLFHYSKVRLVKPQVGGYAANPLDHHYSRDYYWRN